MGARTNWSRRLYGLLLLAYPAEFRREYGAEMAHMFGDLCREELRHAGARGLAAVWARAIWDVAVSAPVERMDTLWQDLKYGARSLWHDRAFSAVAIIALAFGAGVNTAIFSVVDGVLLRPLPFADSGRLVAVETSNPLIQITPGPPRRRTSTTGEPRAARSPTWPRSRPGTRSSRRAAIPSGSRPATSPSGSSRCSASRRSPAAPSRPRRRSTADPTLAVLGRGLWQRRFGGDPSVVGRAISISGRSFTVIGVVPDAFEPLIGPVEVGGRCTDPPENIARDNRGLNVVGRLAPGALITDAESELQAVSRRLEQEFPKTNAGWAST